MVLSIIMHVTLQKIVAHDFRYDPRNFGKCNEAEQKLNVALLCVLDIVVRIKLDYICKMLNAITIRCNLKGNYTSKSYTKLQ